MNLDIKSQVKQGILLAPQTITATNTPTAGVELTGSTGRGLAIVVLGAITGTTVVATVQINESGVSNFASDTADVAGAVSASISETSDNTILMIPFSLSGRKKYVRAVTTISGTSPSLLISVVLLYGGFASLSAN